MSIFGRWLWRRRCAACRRVLRRRRRRRRGGSAAVPYGPKHHRVYGQAEGIEDLGLEESGAPRALPQVPNFLAGEGFARLGGIDALLLAQDLPAQGLDVVGAAFTQPLQ